MLRGALYVYLAVLALLTGFSVWEWESGTAAGSIGGGMVLLLLVLLGLPWSLVPFLTFATSDSVASLVYGALAALNAVSLHLAVRSLARSRRTP